MNKRLPWTKKDDEILWEAYNIYGYKKWDDISKYLSDNYTIERKPYQCRERYNFHLKPSIKKIKWDLKNYKLLIEKQKEFGNKWVKIKQYFKNTTESTLKNKFNGILKKSLRRANRLFGDKKYVKLITKIKPKSLSRFYDLYNIEKEKILKPETQYKIDSRKFNELINIFIKMNDKKIIEIQVKNKNYYSNLIEKILEYSNNIENNKQICISISNNHNNSIYINSKDTDKLNFIFNKNNNFQLNNTPCNLLNLTISRILIS